MGNITVGGTGKTPLLIYLAALLGHMGRQPAILSRGYRGIFKSPGMNDEAELMKEKLPGIPLGLGADRAKSAAGILANESADVFLLDDGFQHWRLARALDIVCVDATDPWGGGRLIPWGKLREPLGALRRAHVVVLTRAELLTEKQLHGLMMQVRGMVSERTLIIPARMTHRLTQMPHRRDISLAQLKDKNVIALSAIGNPKAFEEGLRHLGATPTPLRFLDHHEYAESDLKNAESRASAKKAWIVTTEKDWMKLRTTNWGAAKGSFDDLFVLTADISFSSGDEEELKRAIKRAIDA